MSFAQEKAFWRAVSVEVKVTWLRVGRLGRMKKVRRNMRRMGKGF
jgi:hypothetical protein